ncbi:sensor histidine kinase [Dyella choica]|uniref:histidine kinase n=1 Tax=Dyella choica TaxID=1927959 RepID=A0A432MBC6_9GAMM|nr:HAMP domain-containing sensor histidine kinase [Dyella choica]RUL79062.1 HAMP domain-containing histidine kinase [Dyella choica]
MPLAQIDRKEIQAEQASGPAGPGYALIDALPWPCIVFGREPDTTLTSNAAFRAEFPRLAGTQTREAFENGFEMTGGKHGARIYFAPDTRRWYRMEHRELVLGDRADALFLINISECVEVLRRHREQHEQLLSTSRMMSVGEMATTLAHELNQPLSAAINYLSSCEQIVNGESQDHRLRQGIHLAKRQAERAAQIIGSIREFVRSREPHRQHLDTRKLIRNVIEMLRLEAEQYQVQIISSIAQDLPPIFADRVMIEQVLLNLIKNAIEAMHGTPPARRRIHLAARLDDDDMVEIRVIDQGCGIDENGMQQLFTPMYTTKPDGLGIGLAICRSIIEYHEGRLFAEPNHEDGQGAALVFTVPRGLA